MFMSQVSTPSNRNLFVSLFFSLLFDIFQWENKHVSLSRLKVFHYLLSFFNRKFEN